MKTFYKKAGLAIALGATTLALAAPAEAQCYRGRGYDRGYDRGYRGDRGGTALVAGIAGLAIGAAIASNNRDPYRDRYYRSRGYRPDYDSYYYNDHGYYPDDGYYAYSYRERYPRCRIERRWDGYWRRSVRVRVCY